MTLRVKHEKDSVKFNLRHAQDHISEANLHAVKLKKNAPKKSMGTFKIVKKGKKKWWTTQHSLS